ncbi:MAG: UDP-N-acetylmuramoyl-L-alanine--D-glutamate ligase [Spirochaetaceae bacterium]|jgi:UDP-N-acetylmuramoylalanine--D-glutamate ligase|nr:UDP-N-acetylmuramoyl-L-alanine--D-glutamate ligase [Spirochaetaceae bacterium]
MAEVSFRYAGMKAVIMGLGLNGGGLESARYLARRGAELTVTDLRDEKVLAPSIKELEGLKGIRYVLGRHEMEDFRNADMVVKNPGVPPLSPYLVCAKRIETDISLFLAASPARLSAVTGSKGKSSTAAAMHWVQKTLEGPEQRSFLGGNIAVSPLSFLDEARPGDDVVLELSSWQLGDLAGRKREGSGEALLKPRAALLTAIIPDHLDRYGIMDAYVNDKKIIYRGQDSGDCTVAGDDTWGSVFLAETRARPLVYASGPLPEDAAGAWLDGPGGPGLVRIDGQVAELVPAKLLIPGRHQKKNLLAAGLALLDLGLAPDAICHCLGQFRGIEHRLEFFCEKDGVRFYNDSAATIPEAAAAGIEAFDSPPVLLAGGNDKGLDYGPLVRAASKTKAIILLAGTGSLKLSPLLKERGIPFQGPYDDLDTAVLRAIDAANGKGVVALCPGCTSFGMFLNEFDRGRRFKEAVLRLTGSPAKTGRERGAF